MTTELEPWSYYIHKVLTDDLTDDKGLAAAFKTLGEDGWELASSPVIRAPQIGNSVYFVFKKHGAGHTRPRILDPDAPTW